MLGTSSLKSDISVCSTLGGDGTYDDFQRYKKMRSKYNYSDFTDSADEVTQEVPSTDKLNLSADSLQKLC